MAKRDYVLLIGNGVNNVTTDYSWDAMIDDLIVFTGTQTLVRKSKDKPFPLLYEEILAHALKRALRSENEVKRFIAERLHTFQPNDVHQHLVSLSSQDILTTNYDHCLEHTLGHSALRENNDGVVQEKSYSLFRVAHCGAKRIWHIHGDYSHPRSIALGYEHYSGYLQHMRSYIATGTGKAYKREFAPLQKRIQNGSVEVYSWLDSFLTKDVLIIGLTLNYCEIHLWWLLTYRARLTNQGNSRIRNSVTFFIPDIYTANTRDRLELMKSLGVTVGSFPYDRKNRAASYDYLIKRVRARL